MIQRLLCWLGVHDDHVASVAKGGRFHSVFVYLYECRRCKHLHAEVARP